ncbi:MAG TPA: hypothetical protein VGY99_21040 [Candidatus Binataceae bacterium]|nr:hypothetical protein [Candidatus Binataceae bacterium]
MKEVSPPQQVLAIGLNREICEGAPERKTLISELQFNLCVGPVQTIELSPGGGGSLYDFRVMPLETKQIGITGIEQASVSARVDQG